MKRNRVAACAGIPIPREIVETRMKNLPSCAKVSIRESEITIRGKKILVLGDSFFFKGLHAHLKKNNIVRLSVPRNIFSLVRQLSWADVVWAEYAGKWATLISRLKVPAKLVCRLHGFDAFELNTLKNIHWENLDQVVLVSEHMRICVLNSLQEAGVSIRTPFTVLYNGVDLSHFEFNKREPGHRIGVVASVRFGKNYPMLVDIARELSTVDPRYTIHLIGSPHDASCMDTFKYNVQKWGLEKNIIYEGFIRHEDVTKWLTDKHVILSASLHEGHPVGLCEAMACGIKPVIYEYPGAREVFPEDFLFDSVLGAVRKITACDYDSHRYHDWIACRFSIERQCRELEGILNGLLKSPKRHSRWALLLSAAQMAQYRFFSRVKNLLDN